MHNVRGVIDFAVWTGQWPFLPLRHTRLDELREKLESLGVRRAFVSPIEAMFQQEPGTPNKQLLADVKDDYFSPVPILDLSLSNWRRLVDLYISDGRVKMVKLLPNYHRYPLDEATLEPLVDIASAHRLLVSVQIRFEDRRGQHPLMQVPDIHIEHVVKALSYFPQQLFVLQNLYSYELNAVLHSLDNVYFDLASLEAPVDVLSQIKKKFTLNRLLFSSHSPFYFPEGNLYKLKFSTLGEEDIAQVARGNAARLLACSGADDPAATAAPLQPDMKTKGIEP